MGIYGSMTVADLSEVVGATAPVSSEFVSVNHLFPY